MFKTVTPPGALPTRGELLWEGIERDLDSGKLRDMLAASDAKAARDDLAKWALVGLLMRADKHKLEAEDYAENAYMLADAMLLERGK